jgi:hypothetical protein
VSCRSDWDNCNRRRQTSSAREVAFACLRHEAETAPLAALGSVIVRALELGNRLCWDSLGRGDAVAFSRQAAMCAELREFGLCANLLAEDLESG